MRFLLAIAMLVSFTLSAEAQMRRRSVASYGSYQHEIMTNLTRGVFESGELCDGCGSGSVLGVGASYLRNWQDNIQFGGEGFFLNASSERSGTQKSTTRIEALGVVVYNFDSDYADAFYGKAGIGLYSVLDRAEYENKLGFFIGGGKRFSWLSNISYAPEVRLVKKGDLEIGIDIHILNFSIHW